MTSGKHKLEKSTFEKLIKFQQKNKSKIKRVRFVAHFISASNQQLEFKHKGTKYTVDFKIDNAIKFAELMLLYSYKVDNSYVVNYLVEIFEELLVNCNKNTNQIKPDSLKEYGLSIISFSGNNSKVYIFNNKANTPTNDTDGNKIQPTIPNQTSQSDTKNLESNTQSSQSKTFSTPSTDVATKPKSVDLPKCPKCGNITKFATTYCLKCGHKFE